MHLKDTYLPDNNFTDTCDTSTGRHRPFVPLVLRRQVFDSLHSLAHPGIKGPQKRLYEHYVWPRMNINVRLSERFCLCCQRTKTGCHATAPLERFLSPDNRLHTVHIDLAGHLLSSKGYRHLLTIIDRFTHWPEATPLPDRTAEIAASTFVATWVARYRVTEEIVADRGRQYVPAVFRSLSCILGTTRLRKATYRAQASG